MSRARIIACWADHRVNDIRSAISKARAVGLGVSLPESALALRPAVQAILAAWMTRTASHSRADSCTAVFNLEHCCARAGELGDNTKRCAAADLAHELTAWRRFTRMEPGKNAARIRVDLCNLW